LSRFNARQQGLASVVEDGDSHGREEGIGDKLTRSCCPWMGLEARTVYKQFIQVNLKGLAEDSYENYTNNLEPQKPEY